MLRIVYTRRAQHDLLAIWVYIAEASGVDRAEQFVADLKAQVQTVLGRFPGSGTDRDDLQPGLRSWVFKSHVLYYTFDDRHVNVLTVVHGRRDRSSGAVVRLR